MDVSDRVAAGLACCALDQQLAGVLLFDLDEELLMPLAYWLSVLLGDQVAPVLLGSGIAEDNLWERIRPGPSGQGLCREPGLLEGYGGHARVVVLPDLARASLPAARAAVTMIGADVMHLERDGRQAAWQPADRWIASCRRGDAGRISPHLLDRFSVRIDAGGLQRAGAVGVLGDPPTRWLRAIKSGLLPRLSLGAAERSVEYVPTTAAGIRRVLALGRLARACAALEGASVVEREHVDAAARLIGLAAERGLHADASGAPSRQATSSDLPAPPGTGSSVQEVVLPDDEPQVLEAAPITTTAPSKDPYPEDHADPQHEAEPLRQPVQAAHGSSARGYPIGTEAAYDMRDLAISATLLESAKFQAMRCEQPLHYEHAHQMHVSPADLRSYRRAPEAMYLLVLILDHTCRRRGRDWDARLAPFLQWAYVRRASIGLVEVGGASAAHELRAEHRRSRSLLDPRVATALDREPGMATPLAHGISLAAQLLRHDTQQGSASVTNALLVVVTDGRGNIPLAASHAGVMPTRVAGEGVADALQAARLIRTMRRVSSVVIEPGPLTYGHLTSLLADALGATLIDDLPPEGCDGC